MSFQETLFNIVIAGNELWRIILIFMIVLITMFIGRIIQYWMNKETRRYSLKNKYILSAITNAFSKGITFFLLNFPSFYLELSKNRCPEKAPKTNAV